MEVRMSGGDVAFDAQNDDDAMVPAQHLADQRDGPAGILEREEADHLRTSALKQAVGKLDARSRRIIESRWLREKGAATLQDLAAELHVSAERIRQIEAKTLQCMRETMNARGVSSAAG